MLRSFVSQPHREAAMVLATTRHGPGGWMVASVVNAPQAGGLPLVLDVREHQLVGMPLELDASAHWVVVLQAVDLREL